MKRNGIWMAAMGIVLAGLALAVSVRGGDFKIQSFDTHGKVTFNELTNAAKYRVEWASSPGGMWTNFAAAAAGLDAIPARGMGVVTVAVPMCYRVIAEMTNVAPDGEYLVVDLSGGPSASNYPVNYLASVPVGGWTDEYKTTKLVLRRIPAGTFTMGSPTDELGRYDDEVQHQVTMTQPFYIGVFEVTQKQWERVMGGWPSYFTNTSYRDARPVEQVSYNDIRGASAGAGWPANSNVDLDSFMGRLRAQTGKAFDLPTESQWEYAGRAGTTTALNSGFNLTNLSSDAHMSEVGRYYYNGGSNYEQSVDTSGATAKVGSYLPNQWGLYDIHGNVWEWCLDWYGSYPGTVGDPKGATTGSVRVYRGGSWSKDAYFCRVAGRLNDYPDFPYFDVGFRAVLPPGQ